MNNFRAYISDLISLTKPPIISLLLVTATGAIFLASNGSPPLFITIYILIGGTFGAAGASVINNVIDRNIDKAMIRTSKRAVPSRRVTPTIALIYGIFLNLFSFILLNFTVNFISAFLTIFASLFYIFIYTIYLKPRTTQNIVIGGAAGCFPPVIAWVGINGYEGLFNLSPWFMFLIVFLWTPPHFWALGILMKDDYERANIPMLPVVHGMKRVTIEIFIYSILISLTVILFWWFSTLGLVFLVLSTLNGLIYSGFCYKLLMNKDRISARKSYLYSLLYLALIFLFIIIDTLI
tara:strand:+ start:3378 stop:4256 length:879 start_codon:yes stop_codon:yes gene_type:complete